MELFRKHKLLRIQDIIKLNTLINVCSQILIIIAYTRGHQTFFTEGRITERMTSEGRIIIPFNTCKPERKLWEKKTTN